MNSIESKIAKRYNNLLIIPKRKNITFNIDEESLERLDSIANCFYEKDGITTRNALIEDAISSYLESAEDFLESKNLLIDNLNVNSNIYFDTAVFPATNISFTNTFIGQRKWCFVRIAQHRVNNIKYVALYRGAPISAITHFAKVIAISDPNSDNKRVITLEEPIELKKEIPLGDIHVNNVRKLFYTTIDKLKSSTTIKDLIK